MAITVTRQQGVRAILYGASVGIVTLAVNLPLWVVVPLLLAGIIHITYTGGRD